jgi:hypothetical protein
VGFTSIVTASWVVEAEFDLLHPVNKIKNAITKLNY